MDRQAEIPGQLPSRLGRVAVTVDTEGSGGGWRILDGVGTAHKPARLPTLSCHRPALPPPSCSCRKAAPAGGSGEAGLLAFPTCLKSGTSEGQVLCDLSSGQLPWSLGPEAALVYRRDCSRHANLRAAQSQLGLLYPDPDDKALLTPGSLHVF